MKKSIIKDVFNGERGHIQSMDYKTTVNITDEKEIYNQLMQKSSPD